MTVERPNPRRFPVPFTLVMSCLLLLLALPTGSLRSRLAPRFVRLWGWAPMDLAMARLYRMVSSALLTHGGTVFWVALAMVIGMVGLAEWKLGTKRTAWTFWAGHVLTLLALALLSGIYLRLDPDTARSWLGVRDLGPSAGALACLGAVLGSWRTPRATLVALAVLAVIAVDAWALPGTMPAETSADIAHLVALPLGWATALVRRGP